MPGHWAAAYIRAAYQAGILDGTSDSVFSPDQPVTREEASAMVWRYARKSGQSPGALLNLRERPDDWAAEAVSEA
ncbi:S-layer homology domain-containing protein [Paenibacillus sp. P26]|nr:S-layer homology domain-containing protein [Paenibacillus sp. P26]